MLWYILKLVLLLPLLGGMIWGCLWLARRMQSNALAKGEARAARLVESTMLSPGIRLAVIEFHGREILVGASRNGLVRLAEVPMREEVKQ